MCMKYIDATASLFKSVTIQNNKLMSYNAALKGITTHTDNNQLFVDDFAIVTQIDFRGTNNEKQAKENPLVKKETIDFVIRLTKCDKIEENRIGIDLDTFSINLEEAYQNGLVDTACFDFYNHTQITNVTDITLPGGPGQYVIKVLIKRPEDTEYTIQSMSKLMIS